MESNNNDQFPTKVKVNIWIRILGLIFIAVVVLIWSIAVSEFKWSAGGGLVLLLPMLWLIKMIWNDLVIQKVKQKPPSQQKQNKSSIIADTNNAIEYETLENNKNTTQTSAIDKIIAEIPSKKPSWIKQGVNFLTFDTSTFRSVFNEGQRRVVLILSIIFPFIVSILLSKDNDILGYFFGSYLLFFISLLMYIWVREGTGNVRTGGNAMRALRNLIFTLGSIFLVLASIIMSIQLYSDYRKDLIMKENTNEIIRQFLKSWEDEDWAKMESLLENTNYIDNENSPYSILNLLKQKSVNNEYKNIKHTWIRKEYSEIVINVNFDQKRKERQGNKTIEMRIGFLSPYNSFNYLKINKIIIGEIKK